MIPFAKAHAYGNDFLYVRAADAAAAGEAATLAIAMCDRHTGIGADGLILYEHEPGAATASMRLCNADGSRAEVSGNGVRALAALLLRDEPRVEAAIDIRTEAGTKRLTRTARDGVRHTFRADMGCPVGVARRTLSAGGETLDVVTLDMGNPQCVLIGPLPDEGRFQRLGAALERHSAFPDGTNIEFAAVEAPDRVRILIWERGVGPTTSSGTGSCAALVAAASYGGASRSAEVVAPGGGQHVEWREDGVQLTGWAELVCRGEWLPQIPRTA
jgi:diaminopimelate epimerase